MTTNQMNSHAWCVVLVTEGYPFVGVAEILDGAPVSKLVRVTHYSDGTRIDQPKPARNLVEVIDPHSAGGAALIGRGCVQLLDGEPRTRNEALAIASRVPRQWGHRVLKQSSPLSLRDAALAAIREEVP